MDPDGLGPNSKSVKFNSMPGRRSMSYDHEETPLLDARLQSKQGRWASFSHPSPHFKSPSLRTLRSYQSIASVARSHGLSRHGPSLHEKERLYYDDYSCIDWNRDNLASHERSEELRRLPGIRGRLTYLSDALQGWFLCLLIGIFTALFAFLIMITEAWLFSIKNGYCATSPFLSASTCPHGQFRSWSDELRWNFLIYSISALIFTIVASTLTLTTLKIFPNSGKSFFLAAGSGIPEVKTILSGFILHEFLGLRTLLVKATGLTLAVASGMNLGKEGPLVHIGACVANVLTRFFPKYSTNESKKREALSSACSAGVAVAFGAPIGGVLFALEEVSYYFPPKVMWKSFFTAAIAAVVLKTLNPLGTGKLVLLETNFQTTWHIMQLPLFIFIGIFGGLYGALFCYLNIAWTKSFRRTSFIAASPVFECAVVCLLTTMLSYWNEWTFLGGIELLSRLLQECAPGESSALCASETPDYSLIIGSLVAALIIKIALTIVTFGIRLPAGIFIPTMCIGALFGRIVGVLLEQAFQSQSVPWFFDLLCGSQRAGENCVVPGTYSMIGAAAALAGVTRMTLSLAVIMFELTNSLDYVMPFMIAILCAKWVSEAIQPLGIYDLIIQINNHPYLDLKTVHIFKDKTLLDLLPSERAVHNTTIDVTHSPVVRASQLQSMVHWTRREAYEDGGFTIVRDRNLIGYIALADLTLALDLLHDSGEGDDQDPKILIGPVEVRPQSATSSISSTRSDVWQTRPQHDHGKLNDLRYIVDRAPLTLSKEASLGQAYEMFSKLGLRYLAILDGPEFLGVIHKKTFVSALRSAD